MVCDINMDEVDGYTLTKMLRARADTRELPIVLVSTLDAPSDREKGFAAGADGFISKRECVMGKLLTEVSSVIARRRAQA
jgi:CheY-like chemotaxis protein